MHSKQKAKQQNSLQLQQIGRGFFNTKHFHFMRVKQQLQTNKKKRDIIEDKKWFIDDEDCTQYIWINIFQSLTIAMCQQLYLRKQNLQKVPKVLPTILTPEYRNLKRLKLFRNNLTSIQPLSYLFAPQLQEIDISDNLIMNISSLNRTNFTQLQLLYLNKNHIQTNPLNRMRTSSTVFEPTYWQGQQDVNFLVKVSAKMSSFMNISNFEQVFWYIQKKIFQKKLLEVIKQHLYMQPLYSKEEQEEYEEQDQQGEQEEQDEPPIPREIQLVLE